MIKIKKILLPLFLVVIVLCLFFGLLFYRAISVPAESAGKTVPFTVAEGQSAKEIAEKLKQNGLIRSAFYFKIYVWLKGDESRFQAGDYLLNTGFDAKKIIEVLTGGLAASRETSVKIIEGWRAAEIAAYLENQGLFRADEILNLAGWPKVDYRKNKKLPPPKDFSAKYSFLSDKPAHYGLEGYLFPDTYRIFKDASAGEVVDKMLGNLDRKLTREMRRDIARQNKTVYQIMIMASILEKEVRTPEDMKIVAGIFWRRIKTGQALQSDATLSYALDDKAAAHSLADLKLNSPYNTYKYAGLPPTPIANPGLAAISAAIYPRETDYNYFLSTVDGETIFSRSLEEHNKNKQKYLKQ